MSNTALLVLLLLNFKHVIVDFYFQTNQMVKEKGYLKELGGYVHAMHHAIATTMIVGFFTESSLILISLILLDFISHYVIDYSKINICKKMNIQFGSKSFWVGMGLDQYAHQIVYITITYILFNY